jgi:sRNA-binding protein
MSNSNRGRVAAANTPLAPLALLAERFPAAFAAAPWMQHRPLKVGVREDLITLDLLPETEVKIALRAYTQRLQYQKCLAAGGSRFDLNGEPCGAVTSEQAACAAGMVARLEAKPAAQTKTAVDASRRKREATQRAQPQGARQPPQPRVWKVEPHVWPAESPTPSMDRPRSDQPSSTSCPSAPAAAAPPVESTPGPKRLGLADLKRAAQERRALAAKP